MRRVIALTAAMAMTSVAGAALADPSEGDKAVARALFNAARQLTAEKKWTEACPKLAESQRLDPGMGTEFFLADCYEQIGRLATAQTHFLEVVAKARAAGQKDREDFARKRADALEARIPKLTVSVSDDARKFIGLAVTRDGASVTEVQWGVPIPVDLGKHVVAATAAGGKRWEKAIDLTREGATVIVTIPSLDPPVVPPPPPPPPVPQVAKAPPPPPKIAAPPAQSPPMHAPLDTAKPPAQRGTVQRTAGWIAGGVGLVGLGFGTGFGVRAITKNNASKADGHCDPHDHCDPTGVLLRGASFEAATVSTVAFVAGGVALAAGIVLVATAPSKRGASARTAAIAIDPGGVSFAGRW